jgi:hypothetical protein
MTTYEVISRDDDLLCGPTYTATLNGDTEAKRFFLSTKCELQERFYLGKGRGFSWRRVPASRRAAVEEAIKQFEARA